MLMNFISNDYCNKLGNANNKCVDLICLSFANIILTHLTGFDGVQHTLGKTQQQGIEQGCHRSVPLTQDR